MPIILPITPSIPDQRFATPIGAAIYVFRFRWNARAQAWFMDVREENDQPIVLGKKVVLGVAIGRTSTHDLFMGGVFVARDTSRTHREATLDDLGSRVQVWYLSRREMVHEVLGAERHT